MLAAALYYVHIQFYAETAAISVNILYDRQICKQTAWLYVALAFEEKTQITLQCRHTSHLN